MRLHVRSCVSFFLISLVLSAAASGQVEPAGQPSGQEPSIPAPVNPAPENPPTPSASQTVSSAKDYSQEAFVIEQLLSRMRFENDGKAHKEYSMRIRVQSEAGVKAWGQLRVGYNSASETPEIVYVRVIKPDGSVVKAGPEAVQDLNPIQQNAQVYTDYHEKHITVPGLRPGDILEFQTVTSVHTPLAKDQFWMQYDFNTTSIVLDEQLEIDIPAGRAVKLKTKPGMDPKIADEGGRRIYRWSTSHLVREEDTKKSDKDKPMKRPKKDEVPAVQMTTFESWEQVGRWYAELEKDRRKPSKEVREKAETLTKGLTTDVDKTEALYDFVATNFRYVSLSLGLGRYQPHSAGEVLANQYGDCKDKHTLLAAMLAADGIAASTVLINAVRKIDPDIPSPGQFNHIITLVPLGNDELWMDTTTEVAPFRLLSFQLRKKQALVIPADGSVPHLEETPADPPMQDMESTAIEGKVSESGELEAQVNESYRGDGEWLERFVFRYLPESKWKTVLEDRNKRSGFASEISDIKVSDPTATRQPFTIAYKVSKSGFVDWSKKKLDLKLPLSFFAPIGVAEDVDSDSDNPTAGDAENFKIGAANLRTYSIKLELASRYTPHVPVPVKVERDYGDYVSSYKLDGSVFTAERKLVTRVSELPPARANDYRAFRRSVMADAAQALSIDSAVADTHSPPAEMKPEELIKSGNDARREGNYTLAVNLLNRAVTATPKSKTAWNDLGLAYYEAHDDQLAINAFQKQVEIDPFHQYSYNNLGRVYLRQRKYEEAEKWFRKQIEVNPLDKYAHTNLGRTLLDWHKYADAIPELDQAASITPNDADVQVRLGDAYLNLGQDEKAIAAFDKAVELSARPGVWNSIAYELALKGVHLDLAQRYSESAVSTVAASLRNVSLDQVAQRDLRSTASLANDWDTLGWVKLAGGQTDQALKYSLAAWQLGQNGEEADHLGQIYAKRGDKAKAEYFYSLALNARSPDPETRGRLAALLGGEQKIDAVIEQHRNDLQKLRTIRLPNYKPENPGSAEFFVLLSPSSSSAVTAAGVKFISGEEKLKSADNAIRSAQYDQTVPDDTPIKILRRGMLTCGSTPADCTFVLQLPEDVGSTE